MKNNYLNSDEIRNSFIDDIKNIINEARNIAVRSVDSCRVKMYWNIGRRIFEEEQQGKQRADYGTYLIKTFLKNLNPNTAVGFLIDN